MQLRIVFFGMNSGYSVTPLNALVQAGLTPRLVVVGVEPMANERRPLVVHHPFRPGRFRRVVDAVLPGEDLPLPKLVQAAHALGLDAMVTSDANALRSRARIASVEPEVFVVAGFPRLLDVPLLRLATLGGLNVHPGKLPEQRGAAPLFWTLKSGSNEVTYSIHVLDEGEDSGDIVAQGKFTFEPGTHGRLVLEQCAELAAPDLVEAVQCIGAGTLRRQPQAKIGIGRCPRPKFRDARVDPKRPAREVFTFIGGCADSYPLFAECGGDRFFIERAVSFDPNGTLPCEFMLTGERLLLECGPGLVEVELRRDGGAIFAAEYHETPDGRS